MNELEPIGFWRNSWDESTSGLPDPRDHVDESWPLRERARVARYLRRGQVVAAYMGYSSCRFECGIPDPWTGTKDLGDQRFVWPEGFAHYVEVHAVRPPQEFLDHIESALPSLPLWWRVAIWWRKRRIGKAMVAAARVAEQEEKRAVDERLHDAVRDGDHSRVAALLEDGEDPNRGDRYGLTPLALASDRAIAELLLDFGADLDPQPPGHITPLARAVKADDVDWFRALVDRGADINGVDSAGRTVLDRVDNVEMAAVLLDAGVDPTLGSPLFWPAHHGNLELLELLLEAGADIEARCGHSPVILAAARSTTGDATLARLIEAGAKLEARDALGQTALVVAAARNSAASVRRLLEAGADAAVRTERGVTALHMAAIGNKGRERSAEVISMLAASAPGCIDLRDWVGRTPLLCACQYGDASQVAALLEAGADPTIADQNGNLPVDHAARRGDAEMRERLEKRD